MSTDQPRYGFDEFGNAITEAYVARAVAEAEAGYDLSAMTPIEHPFEPIDDEQTHLVSFRLSVDLRELAEREAERRGTSVSALAHEALERYLAS